MEGCDRIVWVRLGGIVTRSILVVGQSATNTTTLIICSSRPAAHSAVLPGEMEQVLNSLKILSRLVLILFTQVLRIRLELMQAHERHHRPHSEARLLPTLGDYPLWVCHLQLCVSVSLCLARSFIYHSLFTIEKFCILHDLKVKYAFSVHGGQG